MKFSKFSGKISSTISNTNNTALERIVRRTLFNDLLSDNKKITTRISSDRVPYVLDAPLTSLQKRFIKYYFNRTEDGDLFIPVVKMRKGGMTCILTEILISEYIIGKHVVYCTPNQSHAKEVKKICHKKFPIKLYDGSFDTYGVSNWEQLEHKVFLSHDKYDVVIVDEIDSNANFKQYAEGLKYYARDNNAIVLFIFTPTAKYKKDMQEFIDNTECLGKIVYRYNTITLPILETIRSSTKYLDNDEHFISVLNEALGII